MIKNFMLAFEFPRYFNPVLSGVIFPPGNGLTNTVSVIYQHQKTLALALFGWAWPKMWGRHYNFEDISVLFKYLSDGVLFRQIPWSFNKYDHCLSLKNVVTCSIELGMTKNVGVDVGILFIL